MKEIERRFLFKGNEPPLSKRVIDIVQGYLVLEDNKHVRVRIETEDGIKSSMLAYKIIEDETHREEFQIPIPNAVAIDLLRTTRRILTKRRLITWPNEKMVIDFYPNKLAIVEIEYEEGEEIEVPSFCGKEVTGVQEYSNIQMAINNANKE